jgi:hypothetical protein
MERLKILYDTIQEIENRVSEGLGTACKCYIDRGRALQALVIQLEVSYNGRPFYYRKAVPASRLPVLSLDPIIDNAIQHLQVYIKK